MSRQAPPSPKIRKALAPFAAMYASIFTAVEALSDEDLATLDGKIGAFGQTNCSWAEYAVIRLIAADVAAVRRRRADAAVKQPEVESAAGPRTDEET